MLDRRDFLRQLCVGTAAGMLPEYVKSSNNVFAADGRSGPKPNIVLILIDDLGWRDLTCYGSDYYETPNIDRLAKQGIRFTDAYAACAVCSPTRAAILTGRYPARIGITDWIRFKPEQDPRLRGETVSDYTEEPDKPLSCPRNDMYMKLQELTIAEILKANGYATAHIGKWHLGTEPYYPDKQGFDINLGGCDFGQPPCYFDPYANKYFDSIPTLPPRHKGEYLTDREGDEAVKFITENKDKPFFLYLAHYAVHMPLQGKKELVKKYKDKKTKKRQRPAYAAMIQSVDEMTGKVMAILDKYQLRQNTLIVFTSDNGGLRYATDNSPLREGKGYPYEGGIRVPMIVSRPSSIPQGAESSEPVTSVDVLPTILETVGIDLPKDRAIDGVSLTKLLRSGGKTSLHRDAIYWHFPHYRPKNIVPYSIIREGRWKLIKRYQDKPFELFDLENDISETKDLSEQYPDKVSALDSKLSQWLESVHAKLPRKNPAYNPPNK